MDPWLPWLPPLPGDPKLNINPGDWLVRVSGPEVGGVLWLLPVTRGMELVITDVKAIAGTMWTLLPEPLTLVEP